VARDESFSIAASGAEALRNAGRAPNSRGVNSANRTANTSTRSLKAIDSARGSVSLPNASNARIENQANSSPNALLRTPSASDSVSSWRRMRAGLAPSEERIAISRRR
jgi:hypothetical protein